LPEIRIDADVEVGSAVWGPLGTPYSETRGKGTPGAGAVAFVDGVQRVDAWADLEAAEGDTGEALFASYLAGAVWIEGGGARLHTVGLPRRAVFGSGSGVPIGGYRRVEGRSRPEDALQAARDAMEVEVAAVVATELAGRDGLLVVDGPLHEREQVGGAVGLVKSHRIEYLARPDLRRVVTGLRDGQRTPIFELDSGWIRWSRYLRLPGTDQRGWAGIVRCEVSSSASLEGAVELADRSAATLPRFASSPVKDSRAPQNLVPIGSLERWLRHRLGDRDILERRLRTALMGV
jgi:hypothetical protein